MAFPGRRLVYAAVGSVLLLAVLLLVHTAGPASSAAGRPYNPNSNNLLRRRLRRLQGQDDPGAIQRRARQEVDLVASETRRVEKQLSGVMPGGRRAPPA